MKGRHEAAAAVEHRLEPGLLVHGSEGRCIAIEPLRIEEEGIFAGDDADAVAAYRAAARDTAWTALALYRRARVLVRIADPGTPQALAGFAETFPGDTAAPTALYLLGDFLTDRGDEAGAERWFSELTRRYPADSRSSLSRFRLAAAARRRGNPDSAAYFYSAEVLAATPVIRTSTSRAPVPIRAPACRPPWSPVGSYPSEF